jgi:hypothetical protein
MSDFNNMGVDLEQFWGEELKSDENFKIRSRTRLVSRLKEAKNK